jgi:hypothetical protein
VIRFEFQNLPRSRSSLTTWRSLWDRGEFDHCIENPGFEVGLVVTCAIDALAKVWMGNLGLAEATASGAIRFTGDPGSRAGLCQLSRFAAPPCHKTFQYAFDYALAEQAAEIRAPGLISSDHGEVWNGNK